MIKTALFAAAALLATAATAAPVFAKDVVVRYGDLDLTTAQGQKDLTRRIDRAAKVACDYHPFGHIADQETLRCYRQARTKANTEMAVVLNDALLGG